MIGVILGCDSKESLPFEVHIKSDHNVGHLVLKSLLFPKKKKEAVETIIVGGGIAGMTSAYKLKEEDFLLFELSDRMGGSASAEQFDEQTVFAQGAHYDMVYPDKFGEEVLSLLQKLKIIQKEENYYTFVDKQYMIDDNLLTTCKYKGNYFHSILFDPEIEKEFLNHIKPFYDKITLPSRLSDSESKKLNNISFREWLDSQEINLSQTLIEGLNYHLIDDYGAGIEEVSAFAGIAYYAIRPEVGNCCATFSPPQGNYYFIDKLMGEIPSRKLKTNHLVKSISYQEENQKYLVDVIDSNKKEIFQFEAKNVIYAGQKHSLKYILNNIDIKIPEINQAPWMIVNIVLKKGENIPFGSWQNENLSDASSFMGFVDSSTQFSEGLRVFTAYYCFSNHERGVLKNVINRKEQVVTETIEKVANFFEIETSLLISQIQKVYINLLGHGMPIPVPNYLFNDLNEKEAYKGLVFAGVDNGRLPFLTEAIDSGIVATEKIKQPN